MMNKINYNVELIINMFGVSLFVIVLGGYMGRIWIKKYKYILVINVFKYFFL